MTVQFADKSVPYGVFVNDLAAKIVNLLEKDKTDPEFISQRKAFEIFGRKNIERWRTQGKANPIKRPHKLVVICFEFIIFALSITARYC